MVGGALAQEMLTEQVEVEQVKAALLSGLSNGGHASVGALNLLGELEEVRGGNIFESLSQSLLINVLQYVKVLLVVHRPLGGADIVLHSNSCWRSGGSLL